MDSKHVNLRPDLMARCDRFGGGSVLGYQNGAKDHSRIYATHGLDTDPRGQAISKMAECAFCVWAGLDPLERLDWTNRPDLGWDVDYCGLRIDVKQTKITSRLLMWPYNKVAIFTRKPFDALVLVLALPPLFTMAGWIMKDDFARQHHVAPGGWKIHAGNWYLDVSELFPIESLVDWYLPPFMRKGAVA